MEFLALAPGVVLQQIEQDANPVYRLQWGTRSWQVQPLLYYVASCLNGERSLAEIAEKVSTLAGQHVPAESVTLCTDWLKRQQLIAGMEGPMPTELQRSFGRIHWKLASGDSLAWIARHLTWIWDQKVAMTIGGMALGMRAALFFDLKNSLVDTLTGHLPWELADLTGGLVLLLATVVIALVHELGHVIAAVSCGVKVIEIGAGLNIIYPIFYTRVEDMWAADRYRRCRVAAGGIYAQFLLGIFLYGYWYVNPGLLAFEILLLNDLTMLSNFQPFLKFDGYWILSHSTGIVNLSSRGWGQVRQALSFGRYRDRFLESYRGWNRHIISLYGVGQLLFWAVFAAGVARWTWGMSTALPAQFRALFQEGLTANRLYFFSQVAVWCVILYSFARRLAPTFRATLRKRVVNDVA